MHVNEKDVIVMSYRFFSAVLCIAVAMGASSTIQAGSFEGFSAMLGLAGVGSEVSYKNTYPDDFVYARAGTAAILDLSYSKMIYSSWLVGLGGTYDVTNTKSTDIGPYEYSVYSTGLTHVTIKNHSSLYLQGLYEYSDKVGFFAKLGYHRVTTDLDNPRACIINCGYGHYTNNHYGVGYGFGFITSLGNIFLKSELQMVHYDSKSFRDTDGDRYVSTIRPKTVAGILGIGYHF